MSGDMYLRQTQIFDPSESHKQLAIIGAGGIGSLLALIIGKLGFQQITVYDADNVEIHNIPNQLYGKQHIDKQKVEALAGIVKALTDIDIEAKNEYVEKVDQLPLGDVIYIMALDSLEARQKIYEELKGMNAWLIDGRMGGEAWQMFNLRLDDEDAQKEYEKSLYVTGSDDPCGMRSIIYTLFSLASEMSNVIKRIDAGQKVPSNLTRHMSKWFFIGDIK